jgi:hypothetical protein
MWSVRRMPQKACPHASPFPSNVCAACISTQPPGAFLEIPSWRTALHEFATAGRRILPVTYHPLSSNVLPRGRVSTHHHAHSCTQHRLHSRPPCSSICGIKHGPLKNLTDLRPRQARCLLASRMSACEGAVLGSDADARCSAVAGWRASPSGAFIFTSPLCGQRVGLTICRRVGEADGEEAAARV